MATWIIRAASTAKDNRKDRMIRSKDLNGARAELMRSVGHTIGRNRDFMFFKRLDNGGVRYSGRVFIENNGQTSEYTWLDIKGHPRALYGDGRLGKSRNESNVWPYRLK